MVDELELITKLRPEIAVADEQTRARARSALDQAIAAPPRPQRKPRLRWTPRPGGVVLVVSVLIVAGVVAVFLSLHSQRLSSTSGRGPVELVFRATPTPGSQQVTPQEMTRTARLVQKRLADATVTARVSSKGDELVVRPAGRDHVNTAEIQSVVQATASADELLFYDWEANVLTPSGGTAAGLLARHQLSATTLSQGTSVAAPGAPGGESMSLYQAVKLASKQAPYISASNSRPSSEYFVFGQAGSRACKRAARAFRIDSVPRRPCYLAGPAQTTSELSSALPHGISESDGQIFKVNRGWVVMEAAYGFDRSPPLSDPSAQFFVLRDHVALSGSGIRDAQPSRDQAGNPDVSFGFTSAGATAFQRVTYQIARRGSLVSGLGRRLFQHFAVALGTQLITVPYIDYVQNPFGIPPGQGADIQGGFTEYTARQAAATIGPLPNLRLLYVTGKRTT